MAGRRSSPKESGGRGQKPKRGHGRGHGIHHRPGKGAPRPIASGRWRATRTPRERGLTRLHDEDLADLPSGQRFAEGVKRAEEAAAGGYGAELTGERVPATVLEVRKGNFLVALDAAPELPEGAAPLPSVLRANPRGMLEQFDVGISSLVAAGDAVEVVVPPVFGDEEYEAFLARVKARRNEFRRLHPSGRAIQTLAANVDQVMIVASAGEPAFRPGFVDRVWVCALASGLPSKLVVNKTDLGAGEDVETLLAAYEGLGLPLLRTSVLAGVGLGALRAMLAGKRSVFCGHSGVGKSSLLIALAPHLNQDVRVGEISGYTGKGQHTTTHAKLFRLPECEVIDTPGVREFTPADTDRRNLWGWFPEIAERQAQCRFADCTHRTETGCAILEAVKEGKIHPRRHESYVRIYETLPA